MVENCGSKSDEELVSLSLKNQDFFYYLLNRYENKLLRYLSRTFLFQKDDAKDVLQETFLKIYKNLNGFDRNLKFSSWAYRIAHNEGVSFLRKRGSKTFNSLKEDDLAKISSDLDLENETDKKYSAKRVREIISQLDEKYREVLVLKFLEDKSYEEISDIIKKPIGTVATLISRAKKQFKKISPSELK